MEGKKEESREGGRNGVNADSLAHMWRSEDE